MSIGSPIGLLAALGLLPLAAAYFLRRRHPPVRVSALFLWRVPSLRAEGGPRLQRFTRERSLWLEVAALLAATVYLADLHCAPAAAGRPPLTVVLDGSLSMSARGGDGKSTAERAVAHLRQRTRQASAVTVVQSGRVPRVLAGPRALPGQLDAAMSVYRPHQGDHALLGSLQLAHDLGEGSTVLLLTDHLPTEVLPDWVEVEALGVPLANDAVTYASRHDEGGLVRLVLRVSHFGDAPRKVSMRLRAPSDEGGPPYNEERSFDLQSGEAKLMQATLQHVGPVEVTLMKDALPEDGNLTLWPAPVHPLGVGLSEGLSPVEIEGIQRFVKSQAGLYLDTDRPAIRFGPRGSGADVTLGAPGRTNTFVGPFFEERADPLLEDVALDGVVWTAGEDPAGRALVTTGRHGLIAREAGGAVHLNIDLARSNFTRSPAWPILLANVVRNARARLPGFAVRHALLGEEVHATIPASTRFTLSGPGISRMPLTAGELVLDSLAEPGDFVIDRDGRPVDTVTVLAVDAHESDLRALGTAHHAATTPRTSEKNATPSRPLWPVAAVLFLMLADYRLTREGA